ncbi:hypothetical protein LEL_08813 [Akanthomyces lecanii RCEF 1005]|uniref:Uncharacterized protein n=1 Tax=Akanthomyces lecanii RCEF 1005 TaxID=1081108 RepID=A0A162MZE0_CORDF|nr:hypothetical protein LEL_08813 [Akanthomyces lecanii RCEF 1005]
MPIQTIIFKTESHDQGWSDVHWEHGSYRQSYTWFEMRVKYPVRPGSSDTTAGLMYEYSEAINVQYNDGEMAWDKFNDNFEHMVDIVGYIIKLQEREALNYSSPSLTESLQFRSVIGLPMVAVGHICRVPHVRTRGIALLKSIPFTDGILDSTFFITLTQEQQRTR